MGGAKTIIAVLVLAIAGGTGYWLYADKKRKEERRHVIALLQDTTTELRKALRTPPAPDLVQKLDSNLKLAKSPRDRLLEDAAEHYIQGAREIVRRRADAERLTREASMSRRALSMHMAAAARRDSYWIRVASDLKKRVERDHQDLDLSLKALSQLLFTLPDAQKRLEPHVEASLLLEDAERRAARDRAQQALERAHQELEKVRSLAAPR
jgi:hypothetical protein